MFPGSMTLTLAGATPAQLESAVKVGKRHKYIGYVAKQGTLLTKRPLQSEEMTRLSLGC